MTTTRTPILAAALILAGCNPTPAPRQVEAAAPPAPDPVRPTAVETVLDCAPVNQLFDDLVKRKAAGLTEREALAELSARGAYTEGYVVDAIWKADPKTPIALTRADVLSTCRNVKKTGTTY